jgi:hypothetical protein
MQYKQHPLGQCYPPLAPEEYEKLKAALLGPGPKSPAILFEGQILDGWHYYNACLELGVEPRFETPNIENPALFIIQRNEGRRNLTKGQRGKIARAITNVVNGTNQFQVKKRVLRHEAPITLGKAGEALNVSRAVIDRVGYTEKNGTNEVNEALVNGSLGESKAYRLGS